MRRIIVASLLALCVYVPSASAGVVYELIETGTGNVRATLEFDVSTSNASSSVPWNVPGGSSLAPLLTGGISGFQVDFGSGLEAAISGDIPVLSPEDFQSYTGSELDFGYYWDMVNSIIFPSGSIGHVFADNYAGQDGIKSMDLQFDHRGDWIIRSATGNSGGQTGGGTSNGVPEPGALASLALGLGGLCILARRRRQSTLVQPTPRSIKV